MVAFIIFLKKSRQFSLGHNQGGSDCVYAGIKHNELFIMGFVHNISIDESHILVKPALTCSLLHTNYQHYLFNHRQL